MKNSKFGLKNFRVFDDKGAEFEIAPITVITGGNSSGKSTVFKSLMLLNESFRKMINDFNNNDEYNLFDFKLDFHLGKHNLGTWKNTISRFSKNSEVVLSYSKHSELIDDFIDVSYYFELDKNDFLNRAIISKIQIKNKEEKLVDLELNHKSKLISMSCDALKFKVPFVNLLLINKNLYTPVMNELTKDVHSPDEIKGFESEEEVYPLYENEIYDELLKRFIRIKLEKHSGDFFTWILSVDDRLNYDDLSMLFYVPLKTYFENIEKDKLEKAFDEMIDKKLSNDSLKDEDMLIALRIIKKFIKAFINSDEEDIVAYYKSFEDSYITSIFSEVELNTTIALIYRIPSSNTINLLRSLMGKLSVSNPPHGVFLNTFYNCFNRFNLDDEIVSFNSEKNLEEIQNNFLLLYFSFSLFFLKFDEKFSKDRLDAASDSDIFSVGNYFEYVRPLEYEVFSNFVFAFIQEVLIDLPSFLHDNLFVDAVRVNVQRMYTFKSQGTEFNTLMNEYLSELKSDHKSKNVFVKKYELGTFLRKWVKEFEIADDILFEMSQDGLGVHIYTVKDKVKTLLADEGYGITQLLSILLQIELNILKSPYSYKHPFVHYYETKYKENTISIEEPEVNLHPKFQSKLAEMFVDAYKNYNVRFMLETHSEYLVRKLQTLVAKKDISSTDVSIHYIYPHDKKKRPEKTPQVLKINILEDGRLDKPFGVGFFDEADNLALDLLTFKTLN